MKEMTFYRGVIFGSSQSKCNVILYGIPLFALYRGANSRVASGGVSHRPAGRPLATMPSNQLW